VAGGVPRRLRGHEPPRGSVRSVSQTADAERNRREVLRKLCVLARITRLSASKVCCAPPVLIWLTLARVSQYAAVFFQLPGNIRYRSRFCGRFFWRGLAVITSLNSAGPSTQPSGPALQSMALRTSVKNCSATSSENVYDVTVMPLRRSTSRIILRILLFILDPETRIPRTTPQRNSFYIW